MAGEYDYIADAKASVGAYMNDGDVVTPLRRHHVVQCVLDALRAAHSRGRSEREAELAAEGARLRDLLSRAENALLPFVPSWEAKSFEQQREDRAHARRIHRMLLDEIEAALAAPATEEE